MQNARGSSSMGAPPDVMVADPAELVQAPSIRSSCYLHCFFLSYHNCAENQKRSAKSAKPKALSQKRYPKSAGPKAPVQKRRAKSAIPKAPSQKRYPKSAGPKALKPKALSQKRRAKSAELFWSSLVHMLSFPFILNFLTPLKQSSSRSLLAVQ